MEYKSTLVEINKHEGVQLQTQFEELNELEERLDEKGSYRLSEIFS